MSLCLPYPTLMLVTDRHRSSMSLRDAVRAAVSAGVDLVQLREPDLDDAEIERIARDLIGTIGPRRLVLNGRPGLAARLGLGVHLRDGQRNADVAARGDDRLLGRSIHEAGAVVPDDPPDYVQAGNVFATRTHPDRPGRGLDWLARVVENSPVPVLAIGGIDASNVAGVLRSGCHGIGVIDAILAAADPTVATVTLRQALDRAVRDQQVADTGNHTGILGRGTMI